MLPATTISPSNSCFSFATSWMTSRKHRRVVPVGILQRGRHYELGHFVQPVRQFAASGWPPRGEELVGSPTEQLGLGAQRLVEQNLGRLFATPLTDTTDPAAAPEPLRTGRVLDDSVEREVLADDDLSHSGSPFAGVLSYHRGPRKSCLRYPAWLGLPSRASCLAGSRQSAFGPPGPRREPCRPGQVRRARSSPPGWEQRRGGGHRLSRSSAQNCRRRHRRLRSSSRS